MPELLAVAHDDGGRAAAGFKGRTGDCVCRALAIATGRPYREVYDLLNAAAEGEKSVRGRIGKRARAGRGSSARTGVHRRTLEPVFRALGGVWTPTMSVGSGCTVHLRAGEVPMRGRLAVSLSGHYTAVVDGVIRDTHDPSRDGTRCVYGYWTFPG